MHSSEGASKLPPFSTGISIGNTHEREFYKIVSPRKGRLFREADFS
jgi:hypothetical protein